MQPCQMCVVLARPWFGVWSKAAVDTGGRKNGCTNDITILYRMILDRSPEMLKLLNVIMT